MQLQWQEQEFGGWTSRVCNDQKVLSKNAVNQALEFVKRWQTAFPAEKTWVQTKYQVPSLFIKFDCVFIDGSLFVYEIDERPDGIGLAKTLNPDFALRLDKLKKKWPVLKWVKSDQRCSGDDSFWLNCPSMTLVEYLLYLEQPEPQRKGLVLVRAEPNELDFHVLQERSASLIKNEGLKSYGLDLGLWQEVTSAQVETLPWHYGFVLKPFQGSKCKDVEIWHPGKKYFNNLGIGGLSSHSKIVETLNRNGRMYLQPFIKPMEQQVEGEPFFFMHRLYFAYNVNAETYEPLGGTWVGRMKNFKVHGAEDSVFGPLVLEPNK